MRTLNLIGKDCRKALQNGKIDGFAEPLRKFDHERPSNEVEVDTRRCGKSDERRAQAHTGCRRGGNNEMFGPQGIDNALHGGARQFYTLGYLRQAQSGLFTLERAQNACGPGDDLYAPSSGSTLEGSCFWPKCLSHLGEF
jgi:hypothetical protein